MSSAEDGAGWLSFFRDLVARGLTGVRLVTSDAHAGLVSSIGATLPGASWQCGRTHYAATPKASWGSVKALLHSVYDQPDNADAVHAQFDRILDNLHDKLPHVEQHLEAARADVREGGADRVKSIGVVCRRLILRRACRQAAVTSLAVSR